MANLPSAGKSDWKPMTPSPASPSAPRAAGVAPAKEGDWEKKPDGEGKEGEGGKDDKKKGAGGGAEQAPEEQPSDWPYLCAFIVAIGKDFFLDPLAVGSMPIIGNIVTAISGFMIAGFLFFTARGGLRRNLLKKYAPQAISLLLGVGAEQLGNITFIGALFPSETISMCVIYGIELFTRKSAIGRKLEGTLEKGLSKLDGSKGGGTTGAAPSVPAVPK